MIEGDRKPTWSFGHRTRLPDGPREVTKGEIFGKNPLFSQQSALILYIERYTRYAIRIVVK